MNCIPEQKIEGVYFTSRKPADMSSVTEIEKDRIYTAATENPYISYMNREMNSRRIVSLGRIHAFQKPDFRVHRVLVCFLVREHTGHSFRFLTWHCLNDIRNNPHFQGFDDRFL
jgi:hypothetical protein